MNYQLKDAYRHMGAAPPALPKRFYILITLNKAFRQWQASGKRNNFGDYIKTIEYLGYKVT